MKDFFKNIDTERQTKIDNCVSKLSNTLSILRGKVDLQDYSGIFFLMHLKNIKLLSILKEVISESNERLNSFGGFMRTNNSKRIREDFLYRLPYSSKFQLPDTVCDIFFNSPIIQYSNDELYNRDDAREHKEVIIKLIDAILEIKELENQDIYADVFDSFLYGLNNQKGSISDTLLLEEVSWYITMISRLHYPESIYNPFAGLASFNMSSDHKAKYFGQEINESAIAISMLRLMANKCDPNQMQKGDSILDWNPQKEKFDLIIFNAPFFHRGEDRNKLLFNLEKAIDDLTDNGKLFCVMPVKFFENRPNNRFVRSLIDRDLIESIISLPNNSYYNTTINTEIIIISKSKQLKDSINFCKLDYWFDNKKVSRNARTQSFVKNLPKDFPSNYVNEESSIMISNKELKYEYDYDLSVGNKLVQKFKGVKLSDLLDDYRERGEYKSNDCFIKIADLSSDVNSFELELDKMKSLGKDPKSLAPVSRRFVCLNKDVLLIANRHLNLKPSYYKNSDKKVFLSPNISAFTFKKEDKILPEFLINELYSDIVNAQIDLLRKGSTIPYISANDFLSIRIELPDINEQKVIVNAFNKRLSEIKKYQDKITLLEQESSDEVKNKFIEEASLRHSTGTARANLSSYFKVLNKFFSSDDIDVLKVRDLYKTKKGNDLINVFDDMERDFEFVNSHIRKDNIYDYNLSYVSLEEFLKCIKECKIPDQKFEIIYEDILFKNKEMTLIKNSIKKTLSIKRNTEPIDEDGITEFVIPRSSKPVNLDDGWVIRTNLDLIKIVINNILTNANKHAFDEHSPKNKLNFEGSINNSGQMLIEIRNNGKPFEEGYTKANFIAIHNTTNKSIGLGMGGYDIERHLKHLNCNWELDLTNDLFPVIFNLNFHVTMREAIDDLEEIQNEIDKENIFPIEDIKQIQAEIDIENKVPIEDIKQIQAELEKEAGLSAEEIEDIKQIQANIKKK